MYEYKDKDILYNLYVIDKLSCESISDIYDVDMKTIYYWLNKYNIPIRRKSNAIYVCLVCDYCGKSFKRLKSKTINSDKNFCSNNCRYKSLEGQTLSKEHRKKISFGCTGKNIGSKNGAWNGGTSFGKYCQKFNKSLKENIRNKFNRKCFICGTDETNCKTKLHIHHVDYNKNTLCNGKTWGLIPLCPSCHAKTNFNRWHWFNLLNNYWCYKYDCSWM